MRWKYTPPGKAPLARGTWQREDGAQVFRVVGQLNLWAARHADGSPVRNREVSELAHHRSPDRMARFGTAQRAMKRLDEGEAK
jgi:RecA-family ATPase